MLDLYADSVESTVKGTQRLENRMRSSLNRYKQLKQFSAGVNSDIFRAQLYQVQSWQMKRLKFTHRQLLAHEDYRAATEFVINDLYTGMDHRIVALQIERALPVALKVFPKTALETAAIALELNALTAELDEALTDALFNQVGAKIVCANSYAEAYLLSDQYALRKQQIEMGIRLAEGVDRYLKKKWLFRAFKMARKPAFRGGVDQLYLFMEKAFLAMKPVESAGQLLESIAGVELTLADRLLLGENPFEFEQPTSNHELLVSA